MTMTCTVPSHKEWHNNTKKVKLSTGITMAYMECGNPLAEPLLLVHGFTDSSRIWRRVICELGGMFHIYAVDTRGFGQTDKPAAFAYSMKDYADDLSAFMDAMQIDSAYVMAHSMGTMIGMTLAFSAPKRVKKLLLAAAMMRGHDSAESLAEQYDMYGKMNLALMPQKEMQEIFLPYPENCRDPEFPDGYFATLRGLDAKVLRAVWYGVHQTDNRRFAQFIKAPTLIIWGDRDDVLGEDYQAEVREAFPDAPYLVFPGISHEIPNEMPEDLAALAIEFFLNNKYV